MTEKLLETGRRILEHSRRLASLPSPPGLPAAYASLLQDPAELLADLCNALFSATEMAALAEETLPAERRAAHGFAEQLPPSIHKTASRTHVWPAVSAPDKPGTRQPQPAFAKTYKQAHAQTLIPRTEKATKSPEEASESLKQASKNLERASKNLEEASMSRLPLSLVSGTIRPVASLHPEQTYNGVLDSLVSSTSKPVTSSAQRPAFFGEKPHTDFPAEQEAPDFPVAQEAPLTSCVSSIIQTDSLLQPSAGWSEDVETHLLQRQATQTSSVSFIQGPSQLADVLNSNLTAERRAPFETLSLPARVASPLPDAPADSFAARNWAAFDQRGQSSFASSAARDNIGRESRTTEAGSAEATAAPLVEAVLEELSERLRLEFLRTYGTSGE